MTAFQGELSGFGEPWGSDDLGLLIGTAYQVIAEVAFECYGDNTAEIDETGAKARMMAANFADTEESNTDQVQRFRDALRG